MSSTLHSLHTSSPLLSLSSCSSLPSSKSSISPLNQSSDRRLSSTAYSVIQPPASPPFIRPRRRLVSFKAHATEAESDRSNWWEKNAGSNMIDIHSIQEILNALTQAGDRLVIVEFYGTWCASCRALFPKLCKIAAAHPDILFLKVNFDENRPLCRRLNVKELPYFQFYRGADGLLESFTCSFTTFQKVKDAIARHYTDRCSISPHKDETAESTSR